MSQRRLLQHAVPGLALLLLSAAAAAEEPGAQSEGSVAALKVVVAEGVGAHADRAKARDDAIADAQRRAVEQGVGLYVESKTLVENSELVEDAIYQHAQGYIHSYEVLSDEYREGECRIRIRAQVRTGKIEEDLDEVWTRLKVAGSPRVIVAIDQPQPSDVSGLAQATVTENLVNYGFKILDEAQLTHARSKAALKLLRTRQAREADILALQDAADILIVGRATYRSLGKPQPDLDVYSCEAALDARAIRTDTAEVVASARGTTSPRPAFREDQAIEAALRSAAENWVEQNLGILVKAAVDPARDYTLILTGCSHPNLEAINRQLRELRFVRQTRLRAFDRGVAQLEVEFVGSAQRLAGEMAACRRPGIAVESVTANTIRAQVKR